MFAVASAAFFLPWFTTPNTNMVPALSGSAVPLMIGGISLTRFGDIYVVPYPVPPPNLALWVWIAFGAAVVGCLLSLRFSRAPFTWLGGIGAGALAIFQSNLQAVLASGNLPALRTESGFYIAMAALVLASAPNVTLGAQATSRARLCSIAAFAVAVVAFFLPVSSRILDFARGAGGTWFPLPPSPSVIQLMGAPGDTSSFQFPPRWGPAAALAIWGRAALGASTVGIFASLTGPSAFVAWVAAVGIGGLVGFGTTLATEAPTLGILPDGPGFYAALAGLAAAAALNFIGAASKDEYPRRLSTALFAGAAASFLLPFITLLREGVPFDVSNGIRLMILAPPRVSVVLFVAFGASVLGAALIRAREALAAWLGGIGLGALVLFEIVLRSNFPNIFVFVQGSVFPFVASGSVPPGWAIQYGPGYYAALAAFAAVAAVNIRLGARKEERTR